jgi:hypothetical protein
MLQRPRVWVLSTLGSKTCSNARGEAASTPLLHSVIEEVQCCTGFDGPEHARGGLSMQQHDARGSFG